MLVNICWMYDKCQGKNSQRAERGWNVIFERSSKGFMEEGQQSTTDRRTASGEGLMTSRSHWLPRKLWFLPAQGLLWYSWLSIEITGIIPHVWACWSGLHSICELQKEIFNSREVMRWQLPARCKMGTGVTWTPAEWAPGLCREKPERITARKSHAGSQATRNPTATWKQVIILE